MTKLKNSYKREFLNYLEKSRGYSDLTLKTYDEAITQALNLSDISEENFIITIELMPFRLHIADLNSKTISKKLSAMRSFVDYLNDNDIETILKSDTSLKVAKTLPKPISDKKIEEALELCSEYEALVVVLLYSMGLRVSELTSLEVKDISKDWIRVLGKGNKDRDIPIIPRARTLIDEYLDSYEMKKYLFEKNGTKLSENSLRYIVNKIFKRVYMKVTPHQLRHSYATQLLNNGARIADVSELLGHTSMSTTQIYTKLSSSLKEKNYNLAHPLCREEQ